MSDLETRIAEVLAAHTSDVVYYINAGGDEGHVACHGCDWKAPSFTGFSAHVAAALAPVIAEAKAEALREAVSDFEAHVGVGEFDEQTRRDGKHWAHIEEAWEHQGPYMDWLRNRADKLVTP